MNYNYDSWENNEGSWTCMNAILLILEIIQRKVYDLFPEIPGLQDLIVYSQIGRIKKYLNIRSKYKGRILFAKRPSILVTRH